MNTSLASLKLPRWLPNAFTAVVLLMAGFNYFGVFGDLDWSWQVRTGGQIVESRTLRIADEFSYTIQGTQLHDFEWLYEVMLFLVWDTFGMGGLKLLRVLFVVAPMWIVTRRLNREGVPWHGVLLCVFAMIFVLAPVWNLRPLYCTTIGLLLVSGWLHDHCSGRRPLPWYLPIAMLIWANCHPAVICGQGLLFGAIAWEWLNRLVGWNTRLDNAALKRLTFLGLLGLAATFLSPDPIERIRYAFNPDLGHPVFRHFIEMQPTYTFVTKPPFNFALIYIVAALVLLSICLRPRHYRGWEVAYLLVLALLGNVASRSAMDWFLNMLALGVPHLCVLWRQALETPRRGWVRRGLIIDNRIRRMFTSPLFRLQAAWPLAGVGVLLVLSLIPSVSREMPIQTSDEWPSGAVAYLETNQLAGNFFGPPNLVTFVNWKLKERARSYTDTRGFFFPPTLVEDCLYLPQLHGDWRPRLDRVLNHYPTDYFLLETTGPRGALWHALQPLVSTPLYLDDAVVLLDAAEVRRVAPSLGEP